ncbi:MAG: FtsX-like permease family protein [Chloroflexota bacterium]|nr:FtsX-like permease family protein [Chloroflexota bacterium]
MNSTFIPRLIVRHISRRTFQGILFILGIAVGVAVMVAIDLANNSSKRAFSLSTESVTGRATHQIVGGPGGLPTELYRTLRVDLGIRDTAPVVEGYAQARELGDRAMQVLGIDAFAEPPFRSFLTEVTVEGGEQAQFDAITAFIATPGSVLISAATAAANGIVIGDMLTLLPPNGEVLARVVGTIGSGADSEALDSLLLMDIATAQEILRMSGSLSRIDLILPDNADLAAIEALLPASAILTTPSAQSGALSQMTAAFELNLQALSLLALVVGVFLIYNTVSFSVVQRRAELGTMRALGATDGQIMALILGESALLGFIGTILGLALGILFGRFAVGIVAQTISDLYFSVDVQAVRVDAFTLIKGALIGIVASVIAAFVPALDATRTPPAGSLRRSQLEERTRRLLIPITIAAVALIALGVGLLAVPTNSLIFSFGALFGVIVGGALLTPAMLVLSMVLLTPVSDRLFGVVGRMATRAISRSLSRTSVAVAALTVAVSVIVGVSVMIGSFRGTVADWLETTLGADIYISPPQVTATRAEANVDPALADRVRLVNGIERLVLGRNVRAIAPDYPELPPVNLQIATDEVVSSARRFVWMSVPGGDYLSALADGAVMVSEPFAFRRGITQTRNTITLLTDAGEQDFTVIGVFYDYAGDQGSVFMTDNVYRQFYDDPYISTMAIFVQPDADIETVIADTRAALAGTQMIAQSNRALRESVFAVFERTFAITGALRLLAVVVAFIGILSALLSLQLEQVRQYGVMRAIGLTPGQLWRYTLIQTGLMGLVAGVLALPIGAALATILITVINVRSFGWTMELALTPDEFALALVVSIGAALLAGVYPARTIARLSPARALRGE